MFITLAIQFTNVAHLKRYNQIKKKKEYRESMALSQWTSLILLMYANKKEKNMSQSLS
jgi:hypothetical protein